MRLIQNLYYYPWKGRGNNCHSYLFANVLRGDRPHVLIDPGHVANQLGERCFIQLTAAMEHDSIKAEDIGLLLNTHSHLDHSEANWQFVEKSRTKQSKVKQALISLHKEEAEYLSTQGQKMFPALGAEAKFEPDFYLQEGGLNLGKERKLVLQILHTPGHSPGSISIYWADNKVLIAGDVVFYGSVGRTDIPGGNGRLLRQSIEKLSQLEIDYLLPGHSTEFGDILRGRDKVQQNFAFIRLNHFSLLA